MPLCSRSRAEIGVDLDLLLCGPHPGPSDLVLAHLIVALTNQMWCRRVCVTLVQPIVCPARGGAGSGAGRQNYHRRRRRRHVGARCHGLQAPHRRAPLPALHLLPAGHLGAAVRPGAAAVGGGRPGASRKAVAAAVPEARGAALPAASAGGPADGAGGGGALAQPLRVPHRCRAVPVTYRRRKEVHERRI